MRVVLVTGANRGIGLSICSLLLKSAADVSVVLASRDLEKGKAANKQLHAENETFKTRTQVLELDVSDETSVQRAAATVKEQYGQLFALVNNAGIGLDLAWNKEVKPKKGDAKATLDCNFFGLEFCCRHFLPLLQPGGAIVNVSSGAAAMNMGRMSEEKRAWMLRENTTWLELKDAAEQFITEFDQHADASELPLLSQTGWWLQAYGFSKACVNTYTRMLAAAHPSVRVNSCTPGFCLTGMTQAYDKPDTLRTPEQGAETPVFLVLGDQKGVVGKIWGPDQEIQAWVKEAQ